MREAVELIRKLTETLARAEIELTCPGSSHIVGWNLGDQIDAVLGEAAEFLDIEDGEDDDVVAHAIARAIGIDT
jgi:hypothetical protein